MKNNYIEEEITLAELSERFLGNNDFMTPSEFDMSNLDIEVLTENTNGDLVYKPIKSFVVKDTVDTHYTDGYIKVSSVHKIIENGIGICAKDHPDFTIVDSPMKVVDIEVEDEHTYLANGRLHHNTTSGGKALGFHASCRLRMKQMGQLKGKDGMVTGIKTRVQVIKNRMGPPLRAVDFDIYFDRGIDRYGSWLNMLKQNKLVTQGGAWYTWVDTETGEEHKFQAKDFEELLTNNPDIKEQMYNQICDTYIMGYKDASSNSNIDTTEFDDSIDG